MDRTRMCAAVRLHSKSRRWGGNGLVRSRLPPSGCRRLRPPSAKGWDVCRRRLAASCRLALSHNLNVEFHRGDQPLSPELSSLPGCPMSWALLNRFIESDVFNQNPFLSVAYLSRYAEHVGITYVLCSKLRQFSYEEIEFFLPQLCHLVISLDNESMALEEFLLDLCEESVNGALLASHPPA